MTEKSYQEIWDNCLLIIKDNVTHQNFKTWFKPIKPISIEGHILTIQVPSQFFYEWLENNYITLLKKTIKRELGKDAKLEYHIVLENSSGSKPYVSKIPSINQKKIDNMPVNMPININKTVIRNPFIIPGLQKININPQLNQSYTFDSYVEGECNRLARSAGFAVSQNPGGTSFNPLFIYGGGGLGKTHLANAIGIEVKNKLPEKTVLYVSADKFQTQFVDAIMDNKKNDFVHFYQSIDVLILDDVQFLSGKEKKIRETMISEIGIGEEETDKISEILVPSENVVEMRAGKKIVKDRVFYPGYILVKMNLDKESRHQVENINGVMSFVGPKGEPESLKTDEVNRILGEVEIKTGREVVAARFNLKDLVKINDGPFIDFEGTVIEINDDKQKVKVMVSIFGRSTPVELDYLQVEHVKHTD